MAAVNILMSSGNGQCRNAALALYYCAYEPTDHKNVWRVISSKSDKTYLVHPDGCNCPAGLHEAYCYHRIGARILAA